MEFEFGFLARNKRKKEVSWRVKDALGVKTGERTGGIVVMCLVFSGIDVGNGGGERESGEICGGFFHFSAAEQEGAVEFG